VPLPVRRRLVLDMVSAYRCSAIVPHHKCYIALQWGGLIYPDHCAPFGLTTSGNIQGRPADAVVDIVLFRGVPEVVKWVDDFDFFRFPSSSVTGADGSITYQYPFDLSYIIDITSPLGIQWHDISKKGHDFDCVTEYGGFVWDLKEKQVYISDAKRLKYRAKVLCFLDKARSKVRQREVASIHGTLQHLCFVIRTGRAYLPSLAHLLGRFPNKWAAHHVPRSVLSDLGWWRDTLSLPSITRSLRPRAFYDPGIFVDASTSWGLGMVMDQRWAAWRLSDGWNSAGRDIGWAEAIVMELAVMWVAAKGISDSEVTVRGDNISGIEALGRGRS
jgi:hypothetical protein